MQGFFKVMARTPSSPESLWTQGSEVVGMGEVEGQREMREVGERVREKESRKREEGRDSESDILAR